MTELESAQKEIEKLKRKIKRLEKRLLDKRKYETKLLVHTGATPGYIEHIRQKDEEALERPIEGLKI